MINKTILTGRLTKTPELKFSASGVANITFTLAVQRNFRNSEGSFESDFIQCKAFKKTAELIANNFDKGSQIGIEGSIRTGSYNDQQGKRVYTTDVMVENIHFFDKKDNSQQQQQGYGQQQQTYQQAPQQQSYQQQAPQYQQQQVTQANVSEDELPF